MSDARPRRAGFRLLLVLALAASMLGGTAVGALADHDFGDVGSGHPFHDQISWLVASNATQGYADGTFRPGATVSRQALARFLYVLAGEPSGPWSNGFSDVPANHTFHDEISWMAEQGISSGYQDGTFRPGAVVSRQAAASFLLEAVGLGDTDEPFGSDFTDVPPNHTFYRAISWMAAEGISEGYVDPGGTTASFRPTSPVTRQAIAAFLHRTVVDAGYEILPGGGPGGGLCTADDTNLEPELPEAAYDAETGIGDLTGDGQDDQMITYALDTGAEPAYMLRVVTATDYVAELPLDDASEVSPPRVLGVTSIGGPREVAFVVMGAGASGVNIGLWGLHDTNDWPCELGPVTAPDDASGTTFPVGGTVGNVNGLLCEDVNGDGATELVVTSAQQQAGGGYEWQEQAYRWPGAFALQGVDHEWGEVDDLSERDGRFGLDCPGVDEL